MDPLHVYFDLARIFATLPASDLAMLYRTKHFASLSSVTNFVIDHIGDASAPFGPPEESRDATVPSMLVIH